MPIAHIYILEGRDEARKAKVIREVTEAIVRSLEVRPESARVVIHEVAKSHWGIGGQTVSARR